VPKVLPLNHTTRRHLKKLLHDQLDMLLKTPPTENGCTVAEDLLQALTRGQRLTVSVHVLDPETLKMGPAGA
jgi:hypothetical protein